MFNTSELKFSTFEHKFKSIEYRFPLGVNTFIVRVENNNS